MKYVKIIYIFSLLIFLGCSDKKPIDNYDFQYIKDVEVLSHETSGVKFDNFKKTIDIIFMMGSDVSNVKLKLDLSDGVKMIDPQTPVFTCDLTQEAEVKLQKDNEIVVFKVNTSYQSAPISISQDNWEKQNHFGDLPDYISVYKYKKDIAGKLIEAYIAVADVGSGKGKFRVLGEKKGSLTPTKFYENNAKPVIVLNGGYFWSSTSLGLMIRDGKTISDLQTVTTRKYNGQDAYYYPTTGAFGRETDGTFKAYWAYTSSNTLYAYPLPAPNITGEEPCPTPTENYPEGGMMWKPTDAISAGPLLIKNGEYKNLWQNELFDAASGVGPNVNNPRSAIGYHPNGYVILFVCEGRNKTPNTPGMNLKEVASLLLDVGCTEAINLDGGGSSCMLINGKETIIPSDASGQRAITNAISIY